MCPCPVIPDNGVLINWEGSGALHLKTGLKNSSVEQNRLVWVLILQWDSAWAMFFLLYPHNKHGKLLLLIGYLEAVLLLESSRAFFSLFMTLPGAAGGWQKSGSSAHLKVIPICFIPCFLSPWGLIALPLLLLFYSFIPPQQPEESLLCCVIISIIIYCSVWFIPPINANLPPINANLTPILFNLLLPGSPTWLHGPRADFLLVDPKTPPVQHLLRAAWIGECWTTPEQNLGINFLGINYNSWFLCMTSPMKSLLISRGKNMIYATLRSH